MFTLCPCLYTGPYTTAALLRPNTSNGKPHRIGSSYVRQLSVHMLISQENIRLLECIGQGKWASVVLQAMSLSCLYMLLVCMSLYVCVCVCVCVHLISPYFRKGYELLTSQGLLNKVWLNFHKLLQNVFPFDLCIYVCACVCIYVSVWVSHSQ